jgi:DNA-binding NarL/FixJ family response regulator
LVAEVDTPDTLQALKLGACGLMQKDSSPDLFLKGIRNVLARECWKGRGSVTSFLARSGNGTLPSPVVRTGNHLQLTSRELQIVSAIVDGETNKAIAERLGLSGNTVKHHLTRVFDKLGVGNRLELAVLALRAVPGVETEAQLPL